MHAGFEASLEADGYQLKRDQDGYVLWKKAKNRDGAVLYRKKGKYHGLDSLGEGDNGQSGQVNGASGGSNDGELPLDEGVLYVGPGLNGDGGKRSQNGNRHVEGVHAELEVKLDCGEVVVESEPEVKTRLVVKAGDFWPGLSGDNTQRLALKLEGMLRNGGVEWEVAKHNKRTEETVVKLTGRDRSVCFISEKNFRNAVGDQELDLESLLQNMSSRLYVDIDGVVTPVVSRFVRITQEQLNDSTPLSDLMNWLVNQDQKRNSLAPWGSIMVSTDHDTPQGSYKMKPANRPRQRVVYFSRSTLLGSMGFKVLNNKTGAVSSWISPRGLVIDASMSDERFIEILNELQIANGSNEYCPQFERVK